MRIMVLQTFCFLVFICISLVYCSGPDAEFDLPRPNIVLITIDDLGFNDIGFHGSTQIPTPNIDRFAREGLIFSRFYAQAFCTPSRTALMAGKYPFRLGMHHGPPILEGEPRGLPLTRKILPQYLKSLGYSTHMVGKWHLGQCKCSYYPNSRGFDTYLGTPGSLMDYYEYTVEGGYNLYNNCDILRMENKPYATDLMATWAENAISIHGPGRSAGKPFFLYFAPTAVHASDNSSNYLQTAPHYLDRPEVQIITHEQRRKYAAMVIALDVAVGRIRQALVDNGLENNTMVWFSSDNGGALISESDALLKYKNKLPGSNWPLRGEKSTMWEGGVRVPAFVWGAAHLMNRSSGISDQLFHLTDMLPTLVAAAGGDPNQIEDTDGVNHWDAIRTGTHVSRRTLLPLNIDNSDGTRALIWGSYKLIEGQYNMNKWQRPPGTSAENPLREELPVSVKCNYPEGIEQTPCNPAVKACLFNIIVDPCEINNIASERPEIVQTMIDLLQHFNESYVEPINQPIAPHSLPELHGGDWVPWLDDKKSAV